MAPAIEVERFSKQYRTGFRSKPFEAVSDLSFSVPRGSVVGFLGPNGAGKTTTIGAMLGLLTPSAGTIRIFGERPDAPSVRKRVGHVAEVHPVYQTSTAREQLHYLGRLSGIAEPELRKRIDDILDRVNLGDTGKKIARKFSKGMIQRLGLAQALLHDPELLLLDEPTTGLDPEGRRLFLDVVSDEAAKGRTIFFSTHILSDVEGVCSRAIVVKQGRLVGDLDLAGSMKAERSWNVRFRDASGRASEVLRSRGRVVEPLPDGLCSVCLPDPEKSSAVSELVSVGAEIDSMTAKTESVEQLYLALMRDGENGTD